MALVSYDVSDASGSEEEEDNSTTFNAKEEAMIKGKNKTANVINENDEEKTDDNSTLFSVLPTPKTKPLVFDSELSKKLLLNKPVSRTEKPTKKSVQISVPALSELDEELPRPIAKTVTASSKKSGLFDILPPPKHTGMAATLKLMPDSLKKTAPTPKPVIRPPVKTLPKSRFAKPVVTATLDDNSDDEETGDFFSLSKPVEIQPVTDVSSYLVPEISTLTPEPSIEEKLQIDQNVDQCETEESVEAAQSELNLDEEAIQKLCGGTKRKRAAIQAEFIDVAEKDIVPDKDEWLIKALTEEKSMRSHNKRGGPSTLSKRKHQITYLAYQAKAQEQELQNQWAQNRMTKKQTQSKYGF